MPGHKVEGAARRDAEGFTFDLARHSWRSCSRLLRGGHTRALLPEKSSPKRPVCQKTLSTYGFRTEEHASVPPTRAEFRGPDSRSSPAPNTGLCGSETERAQGSLLPLAAASRVGRQTLTMTCPSTSSGSHGLQRLHNPFHQTTQICTQLQGTPALGSSLLIQC
ncbi:hypothetical protein NN561_006192 [Cricetulus griseus]